MAATAVPGADAGQSGATGAAEIGPAIEPSTGPLLPLAAVGDAGSGQTDASSSAVAAAQTSGGPPGAADGPGASVAAEASRRRLGWRWAARGVALLAVAISVMMIALAIGMRANDAAIDDHLAAATATVLSVSPLRTGVEFVDVTGTTIRPEGGVLYPGLLSVGQQFVVEYSTQDPQIARVAGRTSSVGTVMVGGTLVITYLVTLPIIWFCLRRARLPLLGLRRGPGHDVSPA